MTSIVPTNLAEQHAAAQVLLDLTRDGLAPKADFSNMASYDQDTTVAVNAVKRVMAMIVAAQPSPAAKVRGALIAAAMGEVVGTLLAGLPDTTIQAALDQNARNILTAIGADPTRSGVSVTLSSGPQEKLH